MQSSGQTRSTSGHAQTSSNAVTFQGHVDGAGIKPIRALSVSPLRASPLRASQDLFDPGRLLSNDMQSASPLRKDETARRSKAQHTINSLSKLGKDKARFNEIIDQMFVPTVEPYRRREKEKPFRRPT